MTSYRLCLVSICLGVVAGGCFTSTPNPKRDAAVPGGNGGTGGGALGGSGGGSGGAGGTGGRDAGAPDRTVDAMVVPVDSGPPPLSAEFVMIYDTILKTKCSPCHVTQEPRAGMLDMGDAMTAFTSLTMGTTACATAMPKDRVVESKPEDSYLIKKLTGAAEICGLRMPRGCVEQTDGGATADAPPAAGVDAAASDGAVADAAVVDAAVDARATDARDGGSADARPAPPCLPPEMLNTIKTWIAGLSKIRLLMVHDTANAANWGVQSNFQIGMAGAHPWFDFPNSYIAAVDPAAMFLIGKTWVKVPAASKNYVGGPQATITLSAPADVYLVVDDRWLNMGVPEWLGGWTDSGLNFTIYEAPVRPALPFSLFKKTVPAGAITVPPIGSNRAFDYFIIVD